MNDRFKFRVWNNKNNKFISDPNESYAIHETGKLMYVVHTTSGESGFIPNDDNNYIIQQCTGLKDCEGKLIYDGDIVSTDKQSKDSIGVVFFDKTRWEVKYSEFVKGNLYYYACDPSEIKIIGNIFENLELLENK